MSADWLGPVELLVLHVEEPAAVGPGLSRLLDLVHDGAVLVLDLEVVRAGADGPESLDVGAWGDQAGVDLHAVDGLWSGLLDEQDLREATEGLTPGAVAVVVVYEVTVVLPVVAALDVPGVHLVGAGPVVEADLVTALDLEIEGGRR
ncbi:MAG TPA: hypothetical protein VGC67_17380 [Cellulomonas sp.]